MKLFYSIAIILLPIMAVGLFIGQILFTNNLAQDGSTLKEITEKIDGLTLENARLEQEIASASSLLTIQKKATEHGFIEAKQFFTLTQGTHLVAFTQKR